MGDPRADPNSAAHWQMRQIVIWHSESPLRFSSAVVSASKRADEQVKQAVKESEQGALSEGPLPAGCHHSTC